MRPTFADRRSVRRAVAQGRPVSERHLKPYAFRRIRYARNKFQNIQRGLEASRRRQRLTYVALTAIGFAVLLSGLSPLSTIRVVVGACCVGLGITFLLLQPLADRGVKRLLEDVSRAERIQRENTEK